MNMILSTFVFKKNYHPVLGRIAQGRLYLEQNSSVPWKEQWRGRIVTFRKQRRSSCQLLTPSTGDYEHVGWAEPGACRSVSFCWGSGFVLFCLKTNSARSCFWSACSASPTTPQLTLVLVPIAPHMATIHLSFRCLNSLLTIMRLLSKMQNPHRVAIPRVNTPARLPVPLSFYTVLSPPSGM